jgi:hypothetical protein
MTGIAPVYAYPILRLPFMVESETHTASSNATESLEISDHDERGCAGKELGLVSDGMWQVPVDGPSFYKPRLAHLAPSVA